MATTTHTIQGKQPEQFLEGSLRGIMRQIARQGGGVNEHFDNTHLALQALPLATAEFAQAQANLRNARQYLDQGETGAARYEVHMLLKRLPKLTVRETVEPRHRHIRR